MPSAGNATLAWLLWIARVSTDKLNPLSLLESGFRRREFCDSLTEQRDLSASLSLFIYLSPTARTYLRRRVYIMKFVISFTDAGLMRSLERLPRTVGKKASRLSLCLTGISSVRSFPSYDGLALDYCIGRLGYQKID